MTNEITGEDLEEIDKEVMDDLIEEMEEEQREWFSKGASFLPGSKSNTATRLQFYERRTLVQERMLILDEDYRDKMKAGVYPPLAPLHYFVMSQGQQVAGPFPDENTAMEKAMQLHLVTPEMLASQDPVTKAIVPPSQPPPIATMPSFWAGLLTLGQWPGGWSLMRAHSNDFRKLLDEYGRRKEREAVAI